MSKTPPRRRRRRRYPSQINIEAQRVPQAKAYRVGPDTRMLSVPADMASLARSYDGERAKDGSPRTRPFSVSTFDARPLNGFDWVATFDDAEQTGDDTRTFNYDVPDGYICIVRQLQHRVYVAGQGGNVPRNIATGVPNCGVFFSLLIDGNPVNQQNNIRIDDAICGIVTVAAGNSVVYTNGITYPTYALAKERSRITLQYKTAVPANFNFDFIQPIASGNLLLSAGLNLTSEPLSHFPLIVEPNKGD